MSRLLPPNNPIADAVVAELRRFGVDTSQHRARARAACRSTTWRPAPISGASKVVYDRDYSSIALAKPGDIELGRRIRGRRLVPHHRHHAGHQRHRPPTWRWSPCARRAAKGITVSCDLNYRKNLWKWGKPAGEVMRELVRHRGRRHRQRRRLPDGAGHPGGRGRALRQAGPRAVRGADGARCWREFPNLKIDRDHAARIAQRVAQRLVGVPERPQEISW